MFDARRVGGGASQASAGVLAPYIEGREPGPLRDLGQRSLDLYDGFVERAMATSGLTVQYTRSGTLEIALNEGEAAALRQGLSALTAAGIEAQWFDAETLLAREPLAAPSAVGALHVGVHGFVGVPDLMDALVASAMSHGATLAPDTRVLSINRGGGGKLAVETPNGVSHADHVVLAAGTWAGHVRVADVQPIAVKPIRGQLVHLAWPTAQLLRHVLWGTNCYIVPWLGGRVLVGATVEDAGFEERATAAGVRDLLAAGCALVPSLWQASFTEVRVGLRPASPDGLPVIGRSATLPGLIYATGHYRNGALLAPLTASLVKDLIVGRGDDAALAVVAPSRFGRL